MTEAIELIARAAVIGAGGAALMDVWAFVARRVFSIQGLDYALLGRWIGHWPRGRFVHERIGASAPVRGERPLGWIAHYAIGIAFAFVLLAWVGLDWADAPTPAAPLLVGLGTIVAPWFVMQPAMGAGFAGSRTPSPRATRIRNLAGHAVYGCGLYVAAAAIAMVVR